MTDAQQLIQDAMDRAVDHGEIAGAAMLAVRHGRELWQATAGMRNIERGETMTRDTIFRLYSQTKPVTGTAAMMLIGDGELDSVCIMQPATVRMMTSGAMYARHYPDFEEWQPGCDYNTFMRIVEEPGKSTMICRAGEYGWDGWLGTYFCNDPATGTTFLFMIQLANAGTIPVTRKVKNIVNAHLDS